MPDKLMIGVAAGIVVAAGISVAKSCATGPAPDRWARMRERMEQMPEDFPPRMMFDSVQAIRSNTEEILSLLRNDASEPVDTNSPTP